jgi:hypothetical protein
VPVEYIKPEQRMYAVLEFQGIKFTARSFQIEVALKQVLIVPNVPMFQSCVIRKPSHGLDNTPPNENAPTTNEPTTDAPPTTNEPTTNEPTTNEPPTTDAANRDESKEEGEEKEGEGEEKEEEKEGEDEEEKEGEDEEEKEKEKEKEEEGQLQEVNMDGLDELEHMHMRLKKPTEVYYNMYRVAKQKARELKKNAIAAYLEAKQIKSAHMLEDSSDESDEDEYNDAMHNE